MAPSRHPPFLDHVITGDDREQPLGTVERPALARIDWRVPREHRECTARRDLACARFERTDTVPREMVQPQLRAWMPTSTCEFRRSAATSVRVNSNHPSLL